MASTSEMGHAVNLANFQDLIAFISSYGSIYNPTRDVLKLPQLATLYTKASADLATVQIKKTAYSNATTNRRKAFSTLRPLTTRIISMFKITQATKGKLQNAIHYHRKIHGKNATTNTPDSTIIPSQNSSSQQSTDQLIQHFEGLISILSTEPSYAPNEIDLQIASLTLKLNNLKTLNAQVSSAYTELSNARIQRNKTLYEDKIGLVAIALTAKKYISSIFGTTGPQYIQIRRIKFATLA